MKKRIIFSLFITLIYILGKNVPLVFVAPKTNINSFLNIQNFVEYMIGDDIGTSSIFLLGLSPWMSAMILSRIINFFMDEKASKVAPNQMRMITNILLVVFAMIQILYKVKDLNFTSEAIHHFGTLYVSLIVICQLLAGSFLLIWLVEKNIKFGIGGPSVIIMINIVTNIVTILSRYNLHTLKNIGLVVIFYIMITIILTVILSQSEVHLPVYKASIHNEYAKSNYISLKVNPLGTLPSMYIVAIYSMLISILHVIYSFYKNEWVKYIINNGDLKHPLGIILFMILFFILSIVLTLILIDPKDIAKRLLKDGDCIENVRPGKETYIYLKTIVLILVSFSHILIMIILVLPLIIGLHFKGMSELFSLPLSFMILTSIVLSAKDEYRTRSIGSHYEKRLLKMKGR